MSLVNTVKSKFLEAIRSVKPPGRWKILVVDEHSQRLLDTVLKQFDILEQNVTLIESITSNREPQPGFEAMYILMSTSQNVDRVIRDFSDGHKQYAAAHLFFVDGLSEQLFERLTSSPAEPHLKALQELYINFWPVEAQVFTVRNPGAFFNIYGPPRDDKSFRPMRDRLNEELQFMSKMILNVCLTLGEYPYIRYYVPPHHQPLGPLKVHASTSPPPPPEGSVKWRTNLARGSEARAYESALGDYVSKLLAFMVQQSLDEYKKANPDFPKPSDPPRPRGTLIITDRAMDTFAPLLHEFTYQAMANDLLTIDDGTSYGYKSKGPNGLEPKTATLSDSDGVWTELRHMHMREAIDKLMADFNQFMQEHAGFRGNGAVSLNDMKDMLASLPEFQEQRDKFAVHLNMAEECMAKFERDKLPAIATIEQNCATGVTAEGKTPKTLVEEMVPLLDSRDVVNTNKVRIVALYIQHRDGVAEEDRRRLYQHARLTLAEQDAVNALLYLGVRITREWLRKDVDDSADITGGMLQSGDKDTKKRLKQKPDSDEQYELSRYKPMLRTVLEEHVANKLDSTLFPYVKDYPPVAPVSSSLRSAPVTPQPAVSLRSARPNWHKTPSRGSATQIDNRQRILVFVAGGMTYSEMREAYLLSKSLNKDIIIGSTHPLTPLQFVDDMKVLEMCGMGSRALPNGVSGAGEPVRSAQEVYDQKYYTRDAPPPQRGPPVSVKATGRLHATRSAGSTTSSKNDISSGQNPEEKKKTKRSFFHRFS